MTEKSGWQGRFFEDFEVGDVYKHPIGRTITETDNIWFTLLTANPNQLHFNREYGKRTEFGACLVDSTLTLALVTGLSVQDVSMNVVANLGWDEVRLTAPVFAGDTIFAVSEVIHTRSSKSRPHAGIVTIHTRGVNQDGKVVIRFNRTVMVYKRGHAPELFVFPDIEDA